MSTSIDPLQRLITGNSHYAQEQTARNPTTFTTISQAQTPKVLWIGCADSRVPETTICHCKPGDIFVHRNVANTVHADDRSAASVVEYAVTHLSVTTVVVCGHTRCGGAVASLSDADLGGTLNQWLRPLRELRRRHWGELEALGEDARVERLAELNVRRSVEVLGGFLVVSEAVVERGLVVRGLIYDLATGLLKVLD